jgi:hypothetical protein
MRDLDTMENYDNIWDDTWMKPKDTAEKSESEKNFKN